MNTTRNDSTAHPGALIDAILPLSLLEAVKAHDRPSEVLEDEDLTTSLPRRLGLTGVVENQIYKYTTAARRGRPVPLDDALSLFRLVLRRPDAEAILTDTGQRLARHVHGRVPAPLHAVLRFLPRAVLSAYARRAALRALRRFAAPTDVEIAGKPFVVRITAAPASRLEPAGLACVLYSALIEEIFALFTGQPARVRHTRCCANDEKWCEWRLET